MMLLLLLLLIYVFKTQDPFFFSLNDLLRGEKKKHNVGHQHPANQDKEACKESSTSCTIIHHVNIFRGVAMERNQNTGYYFIPSVSCNISEVYNNNKKKSYHHQRVQNSERTHET